MSDENNVVDAHEEVQPTEEVVTEPNPDAEEVEEETKENE